METKVINYGDCPEDYLYHFEQIIIFAYINTDD